MKYIVLKLDGEEMIFVFPASINHDRFYESITHTKVGPDNNWRRPFRDSEVVSAGFVNTLGQCFGDSMTLKVKSRPGVDTKLLGIMQK